MTPETLGRYRILDELGRGAMGRVYLAHDPQIDRKVAVKTIQIFAALPEKDRVEARERFKREAQAAGRLLHPGIVTLFDVGEHDGVPFLAMEYVEGISLDTFCDPKTLLPVETVVDLVAGVAEALAYAHEQHIVHRDVKPANLMRVGEKTAKIMDFGLAKNPATQLTHDGMLLGTPSYMAPEQIRGGEVDGRTDLFALACVLYEMLTGHKAFGGDSVSTVVYRIVNEDPRDPRDVAERVPEPLASFLMRALAKDPEDRFADGRQFASALRATLGSGKSAGLTQAVPTARGGAAETPSSPEPAPRAAEIPAAGPARRGRSSRSAFVVAIVIVLGAVAGGALYFRSHLLPSGAGSTATVPPAVPDTGGETGTEGASKVPAVAGDAFEARVRTEPTGLDVRLDGTPITGDLVRFPRTAPYGTLVATQDCRTVTHELGPQDAGREIVMVPDPVETQVVADPGVSGAHVRLNGTDVGRAPASLALDLCQDNVVRVDADGYRPAEVRIAAGATPLEARTAIAALEPEPIPKGTVRLPATSLPVTFYLDDRKINGKPRSIEATEGQHELRAVSDDLWIDVHVPFRVRGGESSTPLPNLPPLAELSVQSYPLNCTVYLRREGEDWREIGSTPIQSREIAAGHYMIRVQHAGTGDVRERDVTLGPGANPPVRISFAGGR